MYPEELTVELKPDCLCGSSSICVAQAYTTCECSSKFFSALVVCPSAVPRSTISLFGSVAVDRTSNLQHFHSNQW